MAAGLGSRYGWLKQIDPIGPHGEILLEFALKDAIKIGIEKVVIIVSEAIKADFESMIVPKYAWKLHITLVTQSLSSLPEGFSPDVERTKPWWTAHAVWCARDVIRWPFIVMNADDFYGQDALKQAFDFLISTNGNNWINWSTSHCIVTYPITSTLSPYGTVSRGICEVENWMLTKIVEHTKVGWKGLLPNPPPKEEGVPPPLEGRRVSESHSERGRLCHTAEDGHEIPVPEDAPANMNLFGFQASFFEVLDRECINFFSIYVHDSKREFFLPSVVMHMIREGSGTVTALSTTSQWFGMTNPEDRIETKKKIEALIERGEYL